MTLEEQVSLLSGEDFWSLPAIPRLGLGKLRVTDGPNGARGGGSLIGGVKSAAFPVGIALGATWNPDLVREIGAALAEEAKSKGAHVLLGPTINIHRSVTNGRNFECYSEDPVLTAELAVAYVEGLQADGVAATPKHFAGNESEIQRTTMSSEIDERTLREVYLAPFEAAVKRGRHLGADVLLQPAERHLHLRAPLAADRGAARRLGLRRAGDVRLVRLALDRADGQRRARPRDARPAARPRREARRRRRSRRGQRARPSRERALERPAPDGAHRRPRRAPRRCTSAPTTAPSTAR